MKHNPPPLPQYQLEGRRNNNDGYVEEGVSLNKIDKSGYFSFWVVDTNKKKEIDEDKGFEYLDESESSVWTDEMEYITENSYKHSI